eukprot:6353447-Pyramimonas_sp.AAC.1
MGVLWYKAQLTRGFHDDVPDREHGYHIGRSREGALICQEVLLARLRLLGVSTVTSKEDMANAFGCSTFPAL